MSNGQLVFLPSSCRLLHTPYEGSPLRSYVQRFAHWDGDLKCDELLFGAKIVLPDFLRSSCKRKTDLPGGCKSNCVNDHRKRRIRNRWPSTRHCRHYSDRS